MLRLRWKMRTREGEACRFIRISCERGRLLPLHSHDYPEVFWIDQGSCMHHINGTGETLQTGDLVCVRPGDVHQLSAIARNRFIMSNVEREPSVVKSLCERHPGRAGNLLACPGPMPASRHLSEVALSHLALLAENLASARNDSFHLEGFLLDLLRLLEPTRPDGLPTNAPDWLADAWIKAHETEVFSRGVSGFVACAGRSPEHVARVCRTVCGQTPTALIEKIRMKYAERELRLTSRPVTEIAMACGYETTAQFHRAFRRALKSTPLKYRRWLRQI